MNKDLRNSTGTQKKSQLDKVSEKTKPAATPFQELVYLDVAQQEVAALEDPALIEIVKGGPDTSTRKS